MPLGTAKAVPYDTRWRAGEAAAPQWLPSARSPVLAMTVTCLPAVIGAWGGHAVRMLVQRLAGGGRKGVVVGSVVAAWCSVTLTTPDRGRVL